MQGGRLHKRPEGASPQLLCSLCVGTDAIWS